MENDRFLPDSVPDAIARIWAHHSSWKFYASFYTNRFKHNFSGFWILQNKTCTLISKGVIYTVCYYTGLIKIGQFCCCCSGCLSNLSGGPINWVRFQVKRFCISYCRLRNTVNMKWNTDRDKDVCCAAIYILYVIVLLRSLWFRFILVKRCSWEGSIPCVSKWKFVEHCQTSHRVAQTSSLVSSLMYNSRHVCIPL